MTHTQGPAESDHNQRHVLSLRPVCNLWPAESAHSTPSSELCLQQMFPQFTALQQLAATKYQTQRFF